MWLFRCLVFVTLLEQSSCTQMLPFSFNSNLLFSMPRRNQSSIIYYVLHQIPLLFFLNKLNLNIYKRGVRGSRKEYRIMLNSCRSSPWPAQKMCMNVSCVKENLQELLTFQQSDRHFLHSLVTITKKCKVSQGFGCSNINDFINGCNQSCLVQLVCSINRNSLST